MIRIHFLPLRTKKTSRMFRTNTNGLLINDLCFVEKENQLTQNFRDADQLEVLPLFEPVTVTNKRTLSMLRGMSFILNIEEQIDEEHG